MNDQIRKQMAEWGRRGGLKTKERHGKEHFDSMAQKATKVRKSKAATPVDK
jgi:hypothetical protein